MEHSETATLLKYVHSLQGGELSPVEIDNWHDVIGRFDFGEAKDAVRAQVTASPDRVKPAHIIAQIQRARRDAAQRRAVEAPSRDAVGKPAWYDQAVKAAEDAKDRCVERGYGRSDKITVRSAWAAADQMRQRAEAGVREPEEVAF